MRILFVLGGFRVGGYEVLSVKMANELAQRDNKVAILSLSSDNQISERISLEVKTYFATREFKFDLSVIFRISRVVRSFQPHIILSCAYFEYFLVKFASFLYSRQPKFILAFHITKPFDRKEARWNRIYASLAKLFNDKYIAIHKSQIDFYSKHYGLPRKRFTLIHNGVDIKYFCPEETRHNQNDGIFRIVHVAGLKPLKDQWTLLKAMVELNTAYKKWELKIAGHDQANILPEYQEFVRQHNLAAKIKFLGSFDDTRDILNNADVFVLTSVTEALPLSVIEAIAVGLPCIVTNVGGNPDIIEDGKEGFLVNPGDYKAIAKHLRFLIDNPAKKKEMSIAAREKAVRRFDFNVMMEKYCHLLNHILQK